MTRTSTPLIRRVRAVFQRVRSAVGRRLLGPAGQLLVIVPVYNVAEYLDECLASLRNQTFTDFVIVAVNDGSTDRSLAVLQDAAKQDRRIRIVSQANAGLGAARNTGLRHWRFLRWRRPAYVTFVDPDDVLPSDAFERYFDSVSKTGSVLCVGAIERFVDDVTDTWKPFWISQAHRTTVSATTLAATPQALRDIVACNRMMRRDFWDATNNLFPENVAYEDHLPTLRLYLHGPTFDVLQETTYLWRHRDDGTSIAQQKHDVSNLRDRLQAHTEGLAEAKALGDAAIVQAYISRVLDVDLSGFVKRSVFADDEYRRMLSDFAATFVAQADAIPDTWSQIAGHRGTLAYLAATGRFDEVSVVCSILEEHGPHSFALTTSANELVLDFSNIDDLRHLNHEVPTSVRSLTARQRRLQVNIERVISDRLDLTVTLAASAKTAISAARIRVVSLDGAVLVADQALSADEDGRWRIPLPLPVDGSTVPLRAELVAEVLGVTLTTRRFGTATDLGDKISEALGPSGWRWNHRNGQLRWQPSSRHS